MKIKALKSFCGTVTMGIGEVKDVDDKTALGLIGVRYAEPVEEKPKKATEDNQEEAAIDEGADGSEAEPEDQTQAELTNKPSKKAKK